MQTKVAKWGNSLAVRIPAALAEEVGFACGDDLELELVDGKLVASRKRTVPTLDEMLASVTPGNTHGEFDWGPPVGKEVW